MLDLSAIVKAYDIRGVVPDEFDARTCAALGSAFVAVTGARTVVLGRDMRASSPQLAAAFTDAAVNAGADVVDIGPASTDTVYYASGAWGCPGAMITASHNPSDHNGIKLCRAGAVPIGQDSGLAEIRAHAESGAGALARHRPGSVTARDALPGYVEHLHRLVNLSGIRSLRVVVDAGNGMAGHTAPAVFADSPVNLIPLFFTLDGSFPNHPPNPIEPANLAAAAAAVREHGADLGLAFDGDADRCFVVDERGRAVSPSVISALIAERELAREPGSTVVHNLITSRALPELITARGGRAVRTRVGHSFIKAVMADTGAIFGGEHSGHFYFRDFWFADSGMLAALHVLAALGRAPAGTVLSELVGSYRRYADSGELNTAVSDPASRVAIVRDAFGRREGYDLDELDGLSVTGQDAWFNVRASNTEPMLRLNVEAVDEARMAQIRDEVLALIQTAGSPQ